jgi:YesN/AraC family two-component response regulator
MHVLVIDDDPKFCASLSLGLHTTGENIVATALTMASGLALAGSFAYDTILIDLILPDGNGLDVLAALPTTKSAGATKYLVTGFGTIATAVEAIKLGAADCLTKPIDLDDIVKRLSVTDSRTMSVAKVDARIALVLSIIHRDSKVTVSALSDVTGLGPSRLRHLFRHVVGRSMNAVIKDARLDQAAEALRETFDRVSAIAFRVGFSDAGYFERCFTRRFGMNPSNYRKLHFDIPSRHS